MSISQWMALVLKQNNNWIVTRLNIILGKYFYFILLFLHLLEYEEDFLDINHE